MGAVIPLALEAVAERSRATMVEAKTCCDCALGLEGAKSQSRPAGEGMPLETGAYARHFASEVETGADNRDSVEDAVMLHGA